MKIRVIAASLFDGGRTYTHGDEIDVTPERAIHLIDSGVAAFTEPHHARALELFKSLRGMDSPAAFGQLADLVKQAESADPSNEAPAVDQNATHAGN